VALGQEWPCEWQVFEDPVSHVEIRQLTSHLGHSHHLYFTNPGWFASGRRMLFGSDRENRSNLFSIDLETGAIVQMTDLAPTDVGRGVGFLATSVNPTRDEAYFWYGREMLAIDLASLETRTLWSVPDGFRPSMLNCTADGRFVCAAVFEDLSARFRIDYGRGYIGFPETWEAHPLSRVVRVGTDGSGGETVWEEQSWIGHVNTSPTQPNLLTFCHEGPWNKVDNRIWGLDLDTCEPWKIRPREGDESIGHEYWLADGVHVAYHGAWPDGRKCFGRIRHDNTDRFEADFPHQTGHMHSNEFDLVVGDGSPYVRLWQWTGEAFEGPRILAEHRSSMHIQKVHVHPRFSPDGKSVVYTSDRSGYGNVYLVRVPPFVSLPHIADL
jgi:oligogalacturonide lyase